MVSVTPILTWLAANAAPAPDPSASAVAVATPRVRRLLFISCLPAPLLHCDVGAVDPLVRVRLERNLVGNAIDRIDAPQKHGRHMLLDEIEGLQQQRLALCRIELATFCAQYRIELGVGIADARR